MKPIVVIWNVEAGSADQWADLRTLLELAPEVEFVASTDIDCTSQAIDQATARGAKTIVAAGGDGTVNCVIGKLAQCPLPRPHFAVLPLGTGNDLARSLEVPADPEEAWGIVTSGDVMPLDLVRVESPGGVRYAANMITAGNTGLYMEHLTDDVKKFWGPLVYVKGALDVIQNLKEFRISVTLDDGPSFDANIVNLFIANGRYSGGGMVVAHDANLRDGKVQVILIEDGTVGEMLGVANAYMWDDFQNHELVRIFTASKIEIQASEPIPFTADGDVFEADHVTFLVEPDALAVHVGSPGQVTDQ